VCWFVALVFLGQSIGCKRDRSGANVAPAMVAGNSMAPHFFGKHQSTVCRGCKFTIVSEVTPATNNSVVCPNCGLACNAENEFLAQPADRVSLNVEHLPERWQVIGFQRANDDQASIKRVVGLPGESVWFDHGNVFRQMKDGQAELLRKNWLQQKATRVLVHDNRFQDDVARWAPLEPASPLHASVPTRFQTPRNRWFSFRPKRCYDHSSKQAWTPQIEDSYGFNQTISRSLNRVSEVCLEFEFDPHSKLGQAGGAELLIAIVVGQQTHLARFVFNHDSVDVQLFDRQEQVAAVARCPIDPDLPTCAISNVDSQILVAVGDQQVLNLEVSSPGQQNLSAELLVSFQPTDSAGLKHLRLWRDIYYFSPLSRGELLQRQAGTGLAGTEGYFVVGDNLPVSWDSRRWLLPRVDAEDILGVVDIGQ